MERIIDGIRQFRRDVYPTHKDLFEGLATGQSPQALFITCADSRIVPDLITQSHPGDLFICRNAGNMVPGYNEAHGGVAATIEYAVVALEVADVIVCGHSDCGAMRGILNPEKVSEMPAVKSWLAHGETARAVVKENYPNLSPQEQLAVLTQENVIAQIAQLRTYPFIAAKLAKGSLRLHGWVYNIGTGEVRTWNEETNQFVPIEEYTPVRFTSRLQTVSA